MSLRRGDLFVDPFDRGSAQYVCLYANECRALVSKAEPEEVTIGERTFTRPSTPFSISPGAAVRVVGKTRLPKDKTRLPRMRRPHGQLHD